MAYIALPIIPKGLLMTDPQGGVPSEHPPGSLAHFRAWEYNVSAELRFDSQGEAYANYERAFPPPYYYQGVKRGYTVTRTERIGDVSHTEVTTSNPEAYCPPRPFIVPKSVDATTANRLYGENYYVDWRYELDPQLPEVPPLPPGTHLSFAALRVANATRVGQFKTPSGDKAHSTDDGSDWSTLEWAGAMCGEAGEAANVAKKIRRGDYKKRPELGRDKLAQELADTVIYADLVAKREGIDLGAAVELTWNTKSNEIGFTGRLQRGVFVAGAAVPPAPAEGYSAGSPFSTSMDAHQNILPPAPSYKDLPTPWPNLPLPVPATIPPARIRRATAKVYSASQLDVEVNGPSWPMRLYVLTFDTEQVRFFSSWPGVREFLKGSAALYTWAGRQRDNPCDADYDTGSNPNN